VIAWPEVALSLILAFVLGGLFGAVLLITNKKTMKDKLPFAPFLTVSMVITVFFGYYLIQNYLGLFGM
jgi:leader peptidase (prepilin peptidase)/N-methyltransferase